MLVAAINTCVSTEAASMKSGGHKQTQIGTSFLLFTGRPLEGAILTARQDYTDAFLGYTLMRITRHYYRVNKGPVPLQTDMTILLEAMFATSKSGARWKPTDRVLDGGLVTSLTANLFQSRMDFEESILCRWQ